jgi:putative membrane protein
VPAEPAVRARPVAARKGPQYTRFAPKAPALPAATAYLLILSVVGAFLLAAPGSWTRWAETLLIILFLPSFAAALLTPPLAEGLGGRFTYRRSYLLATVVLGLTTLFLTVWRALTELPWLILPSGLAVLAVAQAFSIWLRHMALFGVSRASHARSLPPSLLQPAFTLLAAFLLFPPSAMLLVATVILLLLGLGAAALVIRASDRPIRREFDASGVALIRPMLDHVSVRDPDATATLEAFFSRHAVPADLRTGVVQFRGARGTIATIALPTVHPGPFAALGASDLPRHVDTALTPGAGVVFVPHTPCNHDLDLPSTVERNQVVGSIRSLLEGLPFAPAGEASPLVSPHPGSTVRAQRIGNVLFVLLSQAPEPTDDIDYAVADAFYRAYPAGGRRFLALVDAHNSYRQDEGDLSYGSPAHRRMLADFEAAVRLAEERSVPGPVRAGAAAATEFTVGRHGIGPTGIRALVIEAAGARTAYVLIDGNNLVQGERDTILAGLARTVDAAEVMTTDNHVVHEVDGGINPVGERFSGEALASAVRAVVERADAALEPVELGAGRAELPGVMVLGPGWTARLLTSLGDTLSVFANLLFTTFLFLLASGLVALAVLR